MSLFGVLSLHRNMLSEENLVCITCSSGGKFTLKYNMALRGRNFQQLTEAEILKQTDHQTLFLKINLHS